MDPSSLWTPRSDFAVDEEPVIYAQAASIIQSQAIRFRRILALAGGILMALAAFTLLAGRLLARARRSRWYRVRTAARGC